MSRDSDTAQDQSTTYTPGPTLSRLYPEVQAGGYSRYDGFIKFYTRVNALVDEDSDVLDFGAGRGQWAMEPLPFPDGSFDLVIADYVFEHVAEGDTAQVAAELLRVLRPGGWIAARTPNKWGLIGVGARVVPNRRHAAVLRKLQPERKVEDIFPTRYAMNTRKHLRRLFPEPACRTVVYGHTTEPLYVGTSPAAWRVASFFDRLTPPVMAATLMVFVQKSVTEPAPSGPAA